MRTVHEDHLSFMSYFDSAFADDTEAMVARATKSLRRADYDTLVGTGLSGTIVTPVLARALGKRFAIVRKKGEGSHSGNRIEGNLGRRWVFVDDFISTGETLRRVKGIVEAVTEQAIFAFNPNTGGDYKPWETKFVGVYLYEPDREGFFTERQCDARLTEGYWRRDEMPEL